MAELKNLRNDFMKSNADTIKVDPFYKNSLGNPKVNFYLADTIIGGGTEKGIIRIAANNSKTNLYKTSKIINPRKYLNVYIGNITFRGRHTDGVTPVPYDTQYHADDAVHLRYLWVGSHYRLLTHETGHWLGLLHVFQSGCSDGDGINDTPAQRGATDGACDLCPPKTRDQSCSDQPSNYNNFMDYSGCRNMFTKMQANAIRTSIIKYRPAIWKSSLL